MATKIVVASCLLLVALVLSGCAKVDAAYFIQVACDDASCRTNCIRTRFQQGACYLTANSVSASSVCSKDNTFLDQVIYPFSKNCSYYHYSESTQTGLCFAAAGVSGYAEYLCGTSENEKRVASLPEVDAPLRPRRKGNYQDTKKN